VVVWRWLFGGGCLEVVVLFEVVVCIYNAAGSQQWTLVSGQCAVRWTGQGQQRAVGAPPGGQERDSGVVAVGSEAGKGCVKESVILLLLKKLGKKLLCKEGKGRKKERSGRWLLLKISVAHTVSLNGTRCVRGSKKHVHSREASAGHYIPVSVHRL